MHKSFMVVFLYCAISYAHGQSQAKSVGGKSIKTVKSMTLTQDQLEDRLVQSADKLTGRKIFMCHNSRYKPQNAEGLPVDGLSDMRTGLVDIKSVSVFTIEHPPEAIYDRESGTDRKTGCDGKLPCYEVDLIGEMGWIKKETVMVPVLVEPKSATDTTVQAIFATALRYYVAQDHDVSLKLGASEEDATCLLGYPDEVNDYGNGGLQWVYSPREDGSQTIVYLTARGHLVENIQRLHQRH